MTQYSGALEKMQVRADSENKVQYTLPIGEHRIGMNALIGRKITLTNLSQINCIHCGIQTNKSYSQGFCFNCMRSLAQCDECIMKPEQCHYAQGTCREPQWGEANCFNTHYVYLANTGQSKVGITRQIHGVVSSRWMDQGATQAIVLYRVSNRLMSGLVETACKSFISDKTNWRLMLKGEPEKLDLKALKNEMKDAIASQIQAIRNEYGLLAVQDIDHETVDIHYPVSQYPEKITSLNLDKESSFTGTLKGIKGQYWMLDDNRVINIRKYTGYQATLLISDQ
ncbi:MAG: Uncharacterised protein [Glaciecola sp. HTCC2999]|jgi:hypothetical protein|nr:MAG: Uncharacterised protein [Glaciecola sp. HTCC2999]